MGIRKFTSACIAHIIYLFNNASVRHCKICRFYYKELQAECLISRKVLGKKNTSDQKLTECFYNITENVEKNICFLIYQWRATKKKYSLQLWT